MRTFLLILSCLVAFGFAARSQRFSLLPQVGFENSKTKISYNNLPFFSPGGVNFSPQASLRIAYTSRQGHGFFLGLAGSRTIVNFVFTDPENGMSNFKATTGNMQLKLEGGYQFNSKPIHLHRTKQALTGDNAKGNGSSCSGNHCCRSSCAGHCRGSRHSMQRPGKGSWVRIQPSVGMGFIPGIKSDLVSSTQSGQTSYEYRAGNWKTALIAGTGFEFGRKNTRLFTISVNYFKCIGSIANETITSAAGAKSITTNLHSTVSGWSMKVGIPFTINPKNLSGKHKRPECDQYTPATGRYRITYRCMNHN